MISTVSTSNLLPLLPLNLISEIEREAHGERSRLGISIQERSMLATSTLVSNTVIGTAQAWLKGELKKLDPNPGDNGCQMRSYLLDLCFSDGELREEASQLKKKFTKIKEVVNERNTDVCSDKRAPEKTPAVFFKEQFANITFSKKMEFLIQCFLLAVTRVRDQQLDNGVILTKTDFSRLSSLSSMIPIIPLKLRHKLVEKAQGNLSANSIELLRTEAEKLTYLDREVKSRVLDMLSPKNTHSFTPDPKYEPKTYGCQLYEFIPVLMGLRERQSLVCIKSIVPPPKKPFWIFLQSKESQAEFSIVSDEAYKEFPSRTPVVIFEGVVDAQYDKGKFSDKIMEIGFTELILSCAAIEPPYEKTSDLSQVENVEAQAEIKHYRELAEKIECHKEATEPLFVLDHILALLKTEISSLK